MNFCLVILIMKIEESMQHFHHVMLYYFKINENANEMQHKRFVQCMKKLLELVKSGLQRFMLEISHWMFLCGLVNQLKLITIRLRHKLRRINVIPAGDIFKISKSIKLLGKMKNVSFMEKAK